jgi:hypothetical protein
MPSLPCSTEACVLERLLRMAPYATSALSAFNAALLRSLLRRGLIRMDAWGVVSLTRRGEMAALAML